MKNELLVNSGSTGLFNYWDVFTHSSRSKNIDRALFSKLCNCRVKSTSLEENKLRRPAQRNTTQVILPLKQRSTWYINVFVVKVALPRFVEVYNALGVKLEQVAPYKRDGVYVQICHIDFRSLLLDFVNCLKHMLWYHSCKELREYLLKVVNVAWNQVFCLVNVQMTITPTKIVSGVAFRIKNKKISTRKDTL